MVGDNVREFGVFMAGFMLERAVCDTKRADTEPGMAFVFTL
jgi:hypothetical protein